MDHTYVDAKNLKSLEDLICNLISEIATLRTLRATQVRAVEIGIMKEDQMTNANTIVWHLDSLIKLYFQQVESVAEVLPPQFSVKEVTNRLIQAHIRKAKAISRKPKEEKCVT